MACAAEDAARQHVNQWTPPNRENVGVVQIAHGVAEYGARYAPFAQFLCSHGFVVVANSRLFFRLLILGLIRSIFSILFVKIARNTVKTALLSQ